MRTSLAATGAVLLLACVGLRAQDGDVFPFPYRIHDFDNGLRLVTIPTGQPGTVAVHCVVSVGSRNEVEEGRSGFAHFFEHMMFRGTRNTTAAEQAAAFKAAGADRNAYTTDDYTDYHTTVPTEELATVLRLEADRFRWLAYDEKAFRTEAMAVYGEYNKNSSDPVEMLYERLRDTAFDRHTYKHTTMGFLRDIRAMPRMYDYSLSFFDRFYRPEYVTIVVAGDVDDEATRALVQREWVDGWQRGGHVADVPAEPPQTAPRDVHVAWPEPTSPWVAVAFKGPAFSVERPDKAALDLIAEFAFSKSSALYQSLYVEQRLVDALFTDFGDSTDPGLCIVFARVREPKDVAAVRDAILATCDALRTIPVDASRLDMVRCNLRYSFAASLDSAEHVAGAVAGIIARTRDPGAVGALHALYAKLTPADLQAAARRYLVASGRTIATLGHELEPPAPPADAADTAGGATGAALPAGYPGVLVPSPSPLVSLRLCFEAGAADDPPGKEGLAWVAAQLLARGSTTSRSYPELLEALFPMAADVTAQVDKELTVFRGTVHRDNLDDYYALLREMLTQSAFDAADLERVKADTITAIEIGLRRVDDEELGKEVLLGELYAGRPYGHLDQGTVSGVRSLTVDDVRSFVTARLLVPGPTIGLGGGFTPAFARRVAADFRGLGAAGDAATAAFPRRRGAQAAVFPPADASPAGGLDRNRLTIVEKTTRATGIHVGFPIAVTRDHPDWVALWLVRSWLGEHRSENSHLYQRLREIRGLNYGDYAYIEYFPRGGRLMQPPPNYARGSAVFSIWIRPVPHENGPFAAKAAWYELDRLCREGLDEARFEATRDFLSKFCALLLQTDDRRLGYALDQRWYGLDDFVGHVRDGLARLTLADVNRVIREHLRSDRLQLVVVTDDGARFRDALLGDAPTPISYETPPAADVLAEDAIIERLRIPLRSDDVRIVPVAEVFER
ncbi:MAG: insulinase family protein [Planctomycetes bacterium]|nr:insulinase family protein [Planctomycetota bacterium]